MPHAAPAFIAMCVATRTSFTLTCVPSKLEDLPDHVYDPEAEVINLMFDKDFHDQSVLAAGAIVRTILSFDRLYAVGIPAEAILNVVAHCGALPEEAPAKPVSKITPLKLVEDDV